MPVASTFIEDILSPGRIRCQECRQRCRVSGTHRHCYFHTVLARSCAMYQLDAVPVSNIEWAAAMRSGVVNHTTLDLVKPGNFWHVQQMPCLTATVRSIIRNFITQCATVLRILPKLPADLCKCCWPCHAVIVVKPSHQSKPPMQCAVHHHISTKATHG